LAFRASFFRKSILERVNSEVTFTVSVFLTSCDGGGKKSSTMVSLPFGASSRLARLFIELAPFSPLARSDNANVPAAHGKPYGENALWRLAYAKEPRLVF
jgi:hypothetical protein